MDQMSARMRGAGGTQGQGQAQRPQQPKVNNIQIKIPETTFQAMLGKGQPGPGAAPPPGGPRPPLDPRVMQALMQRAQGGGTGSGV